MRIAVFKGHASAALEERGYHAPAVRVLKS